jgi:hypothetical protein
VKRRKKGEGEKIIKKGWMDVRSERHMCGYNFIRKNIHT